MKSEGVLVLLFVLVVVLAGASLCGVEFHHVVHQVGQEFSR